MLTRCVWLARRYLPKLISKAERAAVKSGKTGDLNWTPTAWKRSFTVMIWIGVAFVMLCEFEFSFWSGFGTIVWYFLVGMYFVNLAVEMYVEKAFGDFLLKTPVVAILANTQNLVTLGAADFLQFVEGFLTGFAITVCARTAVR